MTLVFVDGRPNLVAFEYITAFVGYLCRAARQDASLYLYPGAKIIKKNTKLDSKQTSNVPC